MRTIESFNWLLNYQRQSGTTTLIKDILNKHDVYVICSNSKEKYQIFKDNENVLPISEIERKLRGKKLKPLIFETTAIMQLLDSIDLNKIEDLNNDIDYLGKYILNFNVIGLFLLFLKLNLIFLLFIFNKSNFTKLKIKQKQWQHSQRE